MNVVINGEKHDVSEQTSLAELLKTLELSASRIAVELNQTVVRRATWTEIKLKENDKIEIVHFVGGG